MYQLHKPLNTKPETHFGFKYEEIVNMYQLHKQLMTKPETRIKEV